ncbi:thylakoid membrane photosystem I accumulation factor [Pleurocapsales cyanobacterium LEGE 06147]|nr:thylakoid membrane photosystem I accumulation factor [Pleurocapsales cyanobacterium LEGE 06147]
MRFAQLRLFRSIHSQLLTWRKFLLNLCLLTLLASLTSLFVLSTSPAWAGLNDDKYEGNIFLIFAGNGGIVPPRLSLVQSFQRQLPTLLVFYLDDSSDCKQFSFVITRLQDTYGRAVSFIPISVDSLPVKSTYTPEEPGYYYEGVVPQTVLFDRKGKVVFNGRGQVKLEEIDDALREVFDLLPRSQSVELKRRSFNEFNSELVEPSS